MEGCGNIFEMSKVCIFNYLDDICVFLHGWMYPELYLVQANTLSDT